MPEATVKTAPTSETSFIQIGVETIIQYEGDTDALLIQIVLPRNSDMQGGLISNESRLGENLLGKPQQSKVTFLGPHGNTNIVEILKVLDPGLSPVERNELIRVYIPEFTEGGVVSEV